MSKSSAVSVKSLCRLRSRPAKLKTRNTKLLGIKLNSKMETSFCLNLSAKKLMSCKKPCIRRASCLVLLKSESTALQTSFSASRHILMSSNMNFPRPSYRWSRWRLLGLLACSAPPRQISIHLSNSQSCFKVH